MIAVIENIRELQDKHAINYKNRIWKVNLLTIISIISCHQVNAGEMWWSGLNI